MIGKLVTLATDFDQLIISHLTKTTPLFLIPFTAAPSTYQVSCAF